MEREHVTVTPVYDYEVVAVPSGPEPDDERLFLLNETEHIDEALGSFKRQSWLKRQLLETDGPTLDELKHYRHKLGTYQNVIDRYEQAMASGIIPFRIVIANIGTHKDRHIRVKVRVRNGTILLTRQLPSRPQRPIGPQHVFERPSYQITSGFVRSGIRIGRTSLAANFTELGAGEEAALVNQSLFLSMDGDTQMEFELSSQHVPELTGKIML